MFILIKKIESGGWMVNGRLHGGHDFGFTEKTRFMMGRYHGRNVFDRGETKNFRFGTPHGHQNEMMHDDSGIVWKLYTTFDDRFCGIMYHHSSQNIGYFKLPNL